MSKHIRWCLCRDPVKSVSTYTVEISDYALQSVVFNSYEQAVFTSQIDSASDFAQNLEILVRAAERGLAKQEAK